MQKLFLFAATAALLSGTTALAQGDECATALAVPTGNNGPFSNVGSTTSVPAWPCAAGGNDVWFSWVASCTGTATLSLCGATYDTAVEAFSGPCGGLVSLGCNDDSCGLQSTLAFACTSGTTYFIRVGGFGGATGSFPLNITCFTPPPGCLGTIFANNNGGAVGGGVYYDLNVTNPAGVTVTGLSTNLLDLAGTVGSIDVLTCPVTRTGNQTIVAAWTQVSTGAVTAAGPGFQSAVAIAPFALPFGSYGIAYRANGVSHAYTNGTGANQNYNNADIAIACGEASNLAFTAPLFTPRVANTQICYSVGTTFTIAAESPYGNGCYRCRTSIYDNRAAATLALNGQNLLFVASAGGYVVTHGGSYTAPSGAATVLVQGDDTEVTQVGVNGTYNVCSNGFISIGGSNGVAYTPATSALLNNGITGWYTWHDFNPGSAGSGQVKYENVGGVDVFTWDGVYDFGSTSPNTLQWRFPAGGSAELSIVTMSGLGNGILVGYSPGGASVDPGNTDLTTLTTVTLCASDANAIALSASARPLLGTSINLNTADVPAAAILSLLTMNFSAVVPGIELSFQGMLGCYQNVALAGLVTLGVSIGNGSWSQPFFIPNNPIYLGTNVFGQSAALVPGANPFGATASNGLRLLVGNL